MVIIKSNDSLNKSVRLILIISFITSHWGDDTMNTLPVKSLGRTVMTSDFVSNVNIAKLS